MRVGIVGVKPGQSWSALAHIPALAQLPDYQWVALSTSKVESARQAGAHYRIEHHYGDAREMIAKADVELVVVTVKAPDHFPLVKAALEAGKAVYCEWPLGKNLAETEALAELAGKSGARTAIGLQARYSPVLAYTRHLLDQGYIGTPLGVTLLGSGIQWGNSTTSENAYTADARNGATLLSIPLMHAMDALCWLFGEVDSVRAAGALHRQSIEVLDLKQHIPLTGHDRIAVLASHASGVLSSIHYHGGMSRGHNLLLEINGTEGDLRLEGDHGHLQFANLTLRGGRGDQRKLRRLSVPRRFVQGDVALPLVHNVEALYRGLREGQGTAPDFAHAVVRHRLAEGIERAMASGERIVLTSA